MKAKEKRPSGAADAAARTQAIIEGLAFAFMAIDARGDITQCNAAAERLFGHSNTRMIGMNLWEMARISLDSPLAHLCRRVSASRQAEEAEIDFRFRGVDKLLWVRVFPLEVGLGALFHDISAIREAELRLDEREARYRELAEHSPAAAWVSGPDGAIEFVNQAMADSLGRPRAELLGDGWIECVDEDDLAAMMAVRAEVRASHRPFRYLGRFRSPDGDEVTIDLYGRPRFDRQGRFLGHVGTVSEAVLLHRAEKLQKFIMAELSHPLKNTMMTVLALVSQSLQECGSPREAQKLITERLVALSAAHDVLTREKWEGAELIELIRASVKSYVGDRVRLDGPSARVPAGVAVALSLALHELATNAVKHGSLSVAGGIVRLSWRPLGRGMEMEWREVGGPPVAPPERTGFGSHLLERGVAGELGGPAILRYEPEGLVCLIRFPIDSEPAPGDEPVERRPARTHVLPDGSLR